jgi:hypothetical protein
MIIKMSTTITYNCSKSTKTRKKYYLSRNLPPPCGCSSCKALLQSTGNIVNTNKNIVITERWRKWTHKIDTPNIKDLNNKNIVKRYHVSLRNIAHALASITCGAKLIGITKMNRLVESTL